MNNEILKEACVESLQEAILAEKRGADRIELCADLSVGGTTPSFALAESAVKVLSIPVMVMIRPRGGSFVYSDQEIRIMMHSIDICKSIGVQGIVTGILTREKEVDTLLMQKLVTRAQPLDVTFHKAIDESPDLIRSVKLVSKTSGINRILTSGGATTARKGSENINKMIDQAGNRIRIIAAGKVTHENLAEISRLIHTNEFHGRKIVGALTHERIR